MYEMKVSHERHHNKSKVKETVQEEQLSCYFLQGSNEEGSMSLDISASGAALDFKGSASEDDKVSTHRG